VSLIYSMLGEVRSFPLHRLWLIDVRGAPVNRCSPYFFEHPENHCCLCVRGTRQPEVIWFSSETFPVPHLPPLFLAGGMIETFGACFY